MIILFYILVEHFYAGFAILWCLNLGACVAGYPLSVRWLHRTLVFRAFFVFWKKMLGMTSVV